MCQVIYQKMTKVITFEHLQRYFLGLDYKSTSHSQLKGLVNIFRLFSEIKKLVVILKYKVVRI